MIKCNNNTYRFVSMFLVLEMMLVKNDENRTKIVKIFHKQKYFKNSLTANFGERFGSLRGEICQISPRNLRSNQEHF